MRTELPADDFYSALRGVWRQSAVEGQVLPSETDLAVDLGVSRSKLREALVRLEAEGLIRRQSGGGTFTNRLALDLPLRLDESFELADMVREAGHVPEVEVVDDAWVRLAGEDARLLEVDEGTPALRTVKRWRSDGVVAVLATDLVPALRRPPAATPPATTPPAAKPPAAKPAAGMTVFEQVEWMSGGRVEWECGWPSARLATADEAALLEVDPGSAVFTLQLIGVGRAGRRGFLAREVHVPGVVQWGLIRTIRRASR